nr:hypothetical protein [Caulobacter sp. FWC2]
MHRIELIARDDRRHGQYDVFVLVLELAGLGDPLVEVMLAHIGRCGQHVVDRRDPPAPAVPGRYAPLIEIGRDRLDAHGTGVFVPHQRQTVDQTDFVSLHRVDLELGLDLGSALLGADDLVADRRTRAVPEPLAGVLLHGAQCVLGVLPRLVLVKEVHDLTHHQAHRIIAQFLGDRDDPHAVARQLAGVELELELVAEEAREGMHQDHRERRRLAQRRVDHRLELRALVVGRRVARLNELLIDGPALRCAVRRQLPLLVGD